MPLHFIPTTEAQQHTSSGNTDIVMRDLNSSGRLRDQPSCAARGCTWQVVAREPGVGGLGHPQESTVPPLCGVPMCVAKAGVRRTAACSAITPQAARPQHQQRLFFVELCRRRRGSGAQGRRGRGARAPENLHAGRCAASRHPASRALPCMPPSPRSRWAVHIAVPAL